MDNDDDEYENGFEEMKFSCELARKCNNLLKHVEVAESLQIKVLSIFTISEKKRRKIIKIFQPFEYPLNFN